MSGNEALRRCIDSAHVALLRAAGTILALSWSNAAAAIDQDASAYPPPAVQLTDGRIEYRGTITPEANAALAALYASTSPKPTALWIESLGGSARAGMELGSWLFAERLDIEVDTFCFSSCANYVFTAGNNKTLGPHASLLWHGGPTEDITVPALESLLENTLNQLDASARQSLLAARSRAELLQQLRESLAELRDVETRFFDKIRVDQRITTLGQGRAPELMPDQQSYLGWDFSLDDLEKLGVCGIQIRRDAEWEPRSPLTGGRIFRIELKALPAFEQRTSRVCRDS